MNRSNRTITLARKLRREQTETEARLWAHLRDRRLKGIKFRRQHPMGRYILDFYCPEAHLAIELDGSGHKRPEQKEYDKIRDQEIRGRGIKILRFWDNNVWENLDGVLKVIWNELQDQPLTPNPSPQRGEGDEKHGLPRGERGMKSKVSPKGRRGIQSEVSLKGRGECIARFPPKR